LNKKNNQPSNQSGPDHYPLVILSDTHLGMSNASTDLLLEFLQNTKCDRLILNGDIVDGWRINLHNLKEFPEAQLRVIDAINRKVAEGTEVIYIPGNHDSALRSMGLFGKTVMGIRFEKELEITDPKGRKLFICHGDRFDPGQQGHKPKPANAKPPAPKKQQSGLKKSLKQAMAKANLLLIDRGYEAGSRVSTAIDKVSERLLHKSIGLFSRVRGEIEGAGGGGKSAKMKLEQVAVEHAKQNDYDGIICGHFHISAKREQDGKLYLNSGDWVESYTALALKADGEWKVVKWTEERQEKGLQRTFFKQAANDNPDKAFRPVTEKFVAEIKKIWPGKNGGKPKAPASRPQAASPP